MFSDDNEPRLPRLLYIGDVPVENSYHGSALLYRLLEDYPVDRLLVIECGQHSKPDRRLTDVPYRAVNYPLARLQQTRLSKYAATCHAVTGAVSTQTLMKLARGFDADAVLTVGHGFSWFAASRMAKQLRLPLHFIVHDDVPEIIRLISPVKSLFQRRFGKIYRQATSRMCVSPYMVSAYRERYGADGVVLYPGRSKQVSAIPYRKPPPLTESPLRIAFAGTLNTGGFVDCLNDLDAALNAGRLEAEILMYGPFSAANARASGFTSPRARFCGLVPADQIVARLSEEADILFLPISFAERDRANMSIHFPSKLTDYTATGLPVLIYGPAYASAIRWAGERSEGFVTVTSKDELASELHRLSGINNRTAIGRAGFDIGQHVFDWNEIAGAFRRCLVVS